MHWLLIGYMFLFIDRPFEVWPQLGDYALERCYFVAILGYWFLLAEKRFLPSSLYLAYGFLTATYIACWALSPWPAAGQATIENWLKIALFSVLFVTSVQDERALKRMIAGFAGVIFLYMLHSLREFAGGRHTYRMGIVRMVGIDSSMGDPNTFGATILYALPFALALRRSSAGFVSHSFFAGFLALAFTCIGLTGSRSAFLGLAVWSFLELARSRHRWTGLTAALLLAPVAFQILPDSLQTRFETILDPTVGPESARESAEGRWQGLMLGGELFTRFPLAGCGPGAWRPATHSAIESHNLYGQLIGETGLLGTAAFAVYLGCLWIQRSAILRSAPSYRISDGPFPLEVSRAVGMCLFLMLLEGNFGHNLFRYNWVWCGAFLIVARHCVRRAEGDEFEEICESDAEADLKSR